MDFLHTYPYHKTIFFHQFYHNFSVMQSFSTNEQYQKWRKSKKKKNHYNNITLVHRITKRTYLKLIPKNEPEIGTGAGTSLAGAESKTSSFSQSENKPSSLPTLRLLSYRCTSSSTAASTAAVGVSTVAAAAVDGESRILYTSLSK